ncbi:ABC transporter substrate-binding protein [Jannaschia pohangensis]|uniref:Amino acid/amide ABC transporter substrate-binding protein, HAAT family n=1 Tax=Jannaschia pohangensis TaxID=390807 RepID=A0A1I3H8K3_9RHOB|nr:ABC transporter substrate-binding protein [Jannaschia pohangensis]SFI31959.1 amino acid/amide ABC transporter substrate-binding protein, HAAT family [Jannaschia pohangensis]
MNRFIASVVAATALTMPLTAQAQEAFKIGVLVTQEGTFTVAGGDGIRGVELAIDQFGGEVAGRPIEWVLGPSDATPDTAVRVARKLIEQDGVDIIVGPLSGSEGIAMRDYSKTIPDKTIINGISGALETTFVDPSPNFFRFNTDGNQWGSGLGSYVVNELGWTNIATVAADYSFGYTNFMGFAVDYCRAGGKIEERFWQPLGSSDFGSVIAALPDDVDAIYLGIGGTDAINFLNQYQQAGSETNIIAGTILVDQSVLTAEGRAKDALIGTVSSGPQADDYDSPAWKAYVEAYQAKWAPEDRFPTPSLFATGYYNATMAALTALQEVEGDTSDGQEAFRAALSGLTLASPIGDITLNENRQATGPVFISEVIENEDGTLSTKMVSKVEGVTQTLGLEMADFAALGLPSRDTPDCDALNGG